ncbi:subtilisin-like protease sbt5.4 [Nicotiana attenuata]|uniref:Subtilisin-like protease sbt5.4 n=1 Tax=Nicotiana attenuata TaxID=49451 RepID=A0A1J6ICD3_NICAT|nr:subtilisin-like protease sbt5.4 [Nicotiana attenuata]
MGNECFDSDILLAFDMAIDDGVDVLSVSLGGDAGAYVNDSVAIGSFHVVKHGIVVVTYAGNSGPGPVTYAKLGHWTLRRTPTASITHPTTQLGTKLAPVMAAFSTIGPNTVTSEILKEVPSQTYEDSMDMRANLEVSSGTNLWSDEVEIMEKAGDATLSPKTNGERQHKEEALVDCLSPNPTINPRSRKTRVDDKEGDAQLMAILIMGTTQESQKGASYIVRSPNQTDAGVMAQGNGKIIPGFAATVKPNLGGVYNLQFKARQEVEKARANGEVMKEATRKSVDLVELAPIGSNMESGQSNNAMQLATAAIDDPGILAGKTFSVTSRILAKGIRPTIRGKGNWE